MNIKILMGMSSYFLSTLPQDKIFVPFFTTKPSGSGIGLSLCKQVMNRHGGNITVQSTVGKGSCFTLLFG